MSIEFLCSRCGQTLRVATDAAGRQARCPKCKQVMTVPHGRIAATELQPTAPLPDDARDSYTEAAAPQDEAAAGTNPFASSSSAWGTIEEDFPGSAQVGNRPVEVGAIYNYAWEVYTANIGLLVGAVLLVMIIRGALAYGPWMFEDILLKIGARNVVIFFRFVSNIVGAIVGVFLSIGLLQMMLKMARRQPADISDLFGGASRLLPTLGVAIILGLMIGAGSLLCLVPGIIVALVWWPAYYLIVDDKCDVVDSFSLAAVVTGENRITGLVLMLLSAGIALLGLLACGIGLIFAAPLISMMWCVAYLMMSDQLPDERRLYSS